MERTFFCPGISMQKKNILFEKRLGGYDDDYGYDDYDNNNNDYNNNKTWIFFLSKMTFSFLQYSFLQYSFLQYSFLQYSFLQYSFLLACSKQKKDDIRSEPK